MTYNLQKLRYTGLSLNASVGVHLKLNPNLTPYEQFIVERRQKGLHRELPSALSSYAVSFSHSDYLGLSLHPALIEAAKKALRIWGTSGHASRLLLKSIPVYSELEHQISSTLSTDKTITFGSGYQANISTLSALLNSKILKCSPLVFCDKLVHASIYQGLKTASILPHRFHHQNLTHLESLLASFQNDTRPKFIIAETLYSMEGTKTDLPQLNQLAEHHNAILYLDEAHALGVCGKGGYGLSHRTIDPNRTIVMGTFSKGLGASGGFISGPALLIDYLINASPGFIYTTAAPPSTIAAAKAAWDLSLTFDAQRQTMSSLATQLWEGFKELGFATSPSPTHIIPLILKTAEQTMAAQSEFKMHGIEVSAIRYPTVPMGQARLRFSIHAGLTQDDVSQALMIAKNHIFPFIQRES